MYYMYFLPQTQMIGRVSSSSKHNDIITPACAVLQTVGNGPKKAYGLQYWARSRDVSGVVFFVWVQRV